MTDTPVRPRFRQRHLIVRSRLKLILHSMRCLHEKNFRVHPVLPLDDARPPDQLKGYLIVAVVFQEHSVFPLWGERQMRLEDLQNWFAKVLLVAVLAFTTIIAAQAQATDDTRVLNERVRQLRKDGKYTEAISVAERYVAVARQRYGEQHAEFATAIEWLSFEVDPQRIQEVLDRDPPYDGGPKRG